MKMSIPSSQGHFICMELGIQNPNNSFSLFASFGFWVFFFFLRLCLII